jgi:hypothetical protein
VVTWPCMENGILTLIMPMREIRCLTWRLRLSCRPLPRLAHPDCLPVTAMPSRTAALPAQFPKHMTMHMTSTAFAAVRENPMALFGGQESARPTVSVCCPEAPSCQNS